VIFEIQNGSRLITINVKPVKPFTPYIRSSGFSENILRKFIKNCIL